MGIQIGALLRRSSLTLTVTTVVKDKYVGLSPVMGQGQFSDSVADIATVAVEP